MLGLRRRGVVGFVILAGLTWLLSNTTLIHCSKTTSRNFRLFQGCFLPTNYSHIEPSTDDLVVSSNEQDKLQILYLLSRYKASAVLSMEGKKPLLESSMSSPRRYDGHGNKTNIWHIIKQT
ncbi:hypothetical protein BDW75DRAFT_114240 [Aspergillus navahoensis]